MHFRTFVPFPVSANKVWIIRVILELQDMLRDKTVTAIVSTLQQYNFHAVIVVIDFKVREMVIDILLKNLMHMDGGIPRGWSWKFVEDQGMES